VNVAGGVKEAALPAPQHLVRSARYIAGLARRGLAASRVDSLARRGQEDVEVRPAQHHPVSIRLHASQTLQVEDRTGLLLLGRRLQALGLCAGARDRAQAADADVGHGGQEGEELQAGARRLRHDAGRQRAAHPAHRLREPRQQPHQRLQAVRRRCTHPAAAARRRRPGGRRRAERRRRPVRRCAGQRRAPPRGRPRRRSARPLPEHPAAPPPWWTAPARAAPRHPR